MSDTHLLADAIRGKTSPAEPSSVVISEPPAASAEDVLVALEEALRYRREHDLPLDYFKASDAWRKVIRDAGWKPGNDFGHGSLYTCTITHPGAATAVIRLQTEESS